MFSRLTSHIFFSTQPSFKFCASPTFFLCICILLTACGQTAVEPKVILIPPVGSVTLNRSIDTPAPEQQLDIGVLIFETKPNGQDAQRFGDWVFAEIRDNETHYLPYVLRDTLLDSNQWGAVRVLPEFDPSLDLQIKGTVLKSDGIDLHLQIQAEDSTGRLWLDKVYADAAYESDYPASTRFTNANQFDATGFVDPFQDIYDQISNDLLAVKQTFDTSNLVDLRRVSQMVYANDLSPETFSYTLNKTIDGRLLVSSLLAENDPMLARVEDMRLRHHLFIDTVDQYYEALHNEMQVAYIIWRRYSFDQINEEENAAQRVFNPDQYGRSRSFLSLTQRYDRYRWSKIYQQEFRELASGFNREIAPAILDLNKDVHGLSGTMEEQYIQWRRILRALFELESGQEVSAN